MSSPRRTSLLRHSAVLWVGAIFAVCSANAQSTLPSTSTDTLSTGESSSSALQLVADSDSGGGSALPSAPAAEGAGGGRGAGQEAGTKHGIFSNLAFEAGAGANAPIGNDTPFITWGGNFTVGAGKHFGHGISLLGEYQFIDNKLPGALIAEVGTQGGNTHIWSITAAPVIDLMPKRKTSAYVTGGFGFYHKTTNFTVPVEGEECDYYCGIVVENESVFGFNSRQWGGNAGVGIYHRLGGVYGDGQTKLFAEARYLFLNTPSINANNGTGTTELIPVTLGVRW